MNDSPKNLFEKLFIDEQNVLMQLETQINLASEIFNIERPSGRILFKNFGNLSDPQRISALLVGKYFAVKAGLPNVSDSLSVTEISKELGRPKTALSGPLKDLLLKGFIEKMSDKKYRIAYQRIQEIFDTILIKKIGENENEIR